MPVCGAESNKIFCKLSNLVISTFNLSQNTPFSTIAIN